MYLDAGNGNEFHSNQSKVNASNYFMYKKYYFPTFLNPHAYFRYIYECTRDIPGTLVM